MVMPHRSMQALMYRDGFAILRIVLLGISKET